MASSLWFSPIPGGIFSSSFGVNGGKRTHLGGREGGTEEGRKGKAYLGTFGLILHINKCTSTCTYRIGPTF